MKDVHDVKISAHTIMNCDSRVVEMIERNEELMAAAARHPKGFPLEGKLAAEG